MGSCGRIVVPLEINLLVIRGSIGDIRGSKSGCRNSGPDYNRDPQEVLIWPEVFQATPFPTLNVSLAYTDVGNTM